MKEGTRGFALLSIYFVGFSVLCVNELVELGVGKVGANDCTAEKVVPLFTQLSAVIVEVYTWKAVLVKYVAD